MPWAIMWGARNERGVGCVYVFAVKIENRHEMRVLQGMFAEPLKISDSKD